MNLQKLSLLQKCPRVAIILLNYNGLKDTVECLQSIKRNKYPNYELYLVDNCSNGEDVKILKEQYTSFYDSLIEIKPKNLGFTGGNNFALRKLKNREDVDYFLLLSNDVITDSRFLSELVKVAEGSPNIGIVGPKIYYYDFDGRKDIIQSAGAKINLWLGIFDGKGSQQEDKGQLDKISEVDYVGGSCLLIKRATIKEIGLLDERYFLYFEETDWCLRAKRAGYSILYVPRSQIWHKQGSSMRELPEIPTYYATRNLFWFEKKFANPFQLLLFFGYYFIIVFPWKISCFFLIKNRNKLILLRNYLIAVKNGFYYEE